MKYIFFFASTALSVAGLAQKTLVFSDQVYEPQIKTVQLYPDHGGTTDYLSPAVSVLNQSALVIEFDDLAATRNNYYAKIIHCNYDWTKSNLVDLDYLTDYNEYPINDYSLSTGTYSTYLHYTFQIPPVKIAGNYLLIVYRNDPSDLIISRRFMIFSNSVALTKDNELAGTGALNFSTQQLNFMIDYSQLQITNPQDNVHVVIRQNQRWDNAKTDVKPSFIRDSDSQLEYRFFDSDKFFVGGNEFRFVDFRSLNAPGQNTGKMDKTVKPYRLSVQQDLPRAGEPYTQVKDLNGNYQIDNLDVGEPKTSSNYVKVTFSLKTSPIKDSVYVVGTYNSWNRSVENLATYNPDKEAYEVTLFLKQGLYNYQYLDSKAGQENYFEGNHFETENQYEIMVYNRDFQRNIDILVGYFVVPINPR